LPTQRPVPCSIDSIGVLQGECTCLQAPCLHDREVGDYLKQTKLFMVLTVAYGTCW
jgi:hypothetical protein